MTSSGKLFEQAVSGGEIGLADLFDDDYRPVATTNPPQVLTASRRSLIESCRRCRNPCSIATSRSCSAQRLTGTAICQPTI